MKKAREPLCRLHGGRMKRVVVSESLIKAAAPICIAHRHLAQCPREYIHACATAAAPRVSGHPSTSCESTFAVAQALKYSLPPDSYLTCAHRELTKLAQTALFNFALLRNACIDKRRFACLLSSWWTPRIFVAPKAAKFQLADNIIAIIWSQACHLFIWINERSIFDVLIYHMSVEEKFSPLKAGSATANKIDGRTRGEKTKGERREQQQLRRSR